MDFDGGVDRLQEQHLAGGDLVSHPPLYAPNGELLFLINNRVIQIFSTATGELTRHLSGANSKIIAMEFELKQEDTLVACTEEGEILRWKWRTGTLTNVLCMRLPAGQLFTFNLLNFYANADTACAFVITKCPGKPMQWFVVDTSTGTWLQIRCNMNLTYQKPLVAVDTRNFQNLVITQGFYIFFVNYYNWQWTRLKNALQVPVTLVRMHPKEEMVATGDETGKIFLWRQFMDNHTVCTSLYHWHHTAVTSIAFSASGSSFYSSGMEAVLVKWNVTRPELRDFVPRMSSIIIQIAVNQTNTQVAVCTADNGVQIVGGDNKIKCTLQEFTYIMNDKTSKEKFPIGLRLDPRTNTLVLNGRMGHLQFYSSYTRNLLYNMDIVAQNQLSMEACKILYNIRVTKAAFNIDWMATGEVYNDEEHLPELRLKFWKYQKQTQSYSLNTNIELPHEGGFKAIEFSNDYQVDNLLCATLGVDNNIKIWTLEESDSIYRKGKVWYCMAQTSYKQMPVESISFSQDGSLLAAGYGNTLCIYKADSLKLKAALTGGVGHDGCVQKAQVRIPKQTVNGSKNELAEQRKKIMQLFTNLLESNEKTLIKEIQKSLASNKTEDVPLKTVEQIDDKQKHLLYNKILRMHELNLFQKVLLYQKLNICAVVHQQWEQSIATYLHDTVAPLGKAEKSARLNAQLNRLNMRDRFKAKYRLQRYAKHKQIYDQEISKNLVPIFSVLNLKDISKQPQLTNGNSKLKERKQQVKKGQQVNVTKRIAPPAQALAEISRVQFAAGECAHLVIVCTQHRVLIWNLLTLRLQSVLKLSVDHLSLDPQTNLIAAFTKTRELHVFQPNVPLPIYQRRNLPQVHGAIWLARRYPKPRSLNLDWQAQSTLYFLTESQEIVYLGSSEDASSDAPPPIAFKNDAAPELRYSTFGTYATKQITDKQTNLRQTGPLVIGLSGKAAVKSLIEMSAHTMPPLSLICGEFVKALVKPVDSTYSKDTRGSKLYNGSSKNEDSDDDINMNGTSSKHSDNDDDDDDELQDELSNNVGAKKTSELRKSLLSKAQEIRNDLTTTHMKTESFGNVTEKLLRHVAEQTIELEF